MVPPINVTALPANATLDQVKLVFRRVGYSRLPVYRETLDDVIGVLARRELEPFLEGRSTADEFQLESLVHSPLFISATSKLGVPLKKMQSTRTHLAFVVDEHGGVGGIVTLEDLLEEIVGEINDEYDEEASAQIQEANGEYLLDGMLAVRDANRRLKLRLPEDDTYTTLAGFLLAQAGHLLRKGESIKYGDAIFTVERVERWQIRRVRYNRA
ncbi:MAG: transporter associated domain-containing protein [Acidobacteriota bacterium]